MPQTLPSGLIALGDIRAGFVESQWPCPGPPDISALTNTALAERAEFYGSAPWAPESVWRPSYDALLVSLVDQFNALVRAGFSFHAWNGEGEPYAKSDYLREDLDLGRYMFYLPTLRSGDLPAGHPMSELVVVDYNAVSKGVMLLNDVFRIVHDCIAHSAGHSFGPRGEYRAWLEHRRTLPRDAHLALWNETTGQSLWTNFGPHMWLGGGLLATIPLRERPFAPQRIVQPPEEWT